MRRFAHNRRKTAYLGCAKTARRVQLRDSQYNTQSAQTVLLCRPTTQKLLPKASEVTRRVQRQAEGLPYQCQTFYGERPRPEIALHYKPSQDTLDLGYPRPCGIFCQGANKVGGSKREHSLYPQNRQLTRTVLDRGSGAHSKNDIGHPSQGDVVAPIVPRVTSLAFRVDFPTTELLVQPPTIIAVPHLKVGKPLGYDRYEGRIYPDTNTYPQSMVSSTPITRD